MGNTKHHSHMGLGKLIDKIQNIPVKSSIQLIDQSTIEYCLRIGNGLLTYRKHHCPEHCGIRMMDKLFTEMPQSIGQLGLFLYYDPRTGSIRCPGSFALTGNRSGNNLLAGQKIILFFPSEFKTMRWYDSSSEKETVVTPHHLTFQGKGGKIHYHLTHEKEHLPIDGSLKNTEFGVQMGHLFIKNHQCMDISGMVYSRYVHEKDISSQYGRLQEIMKKSLPPSQQLMRVPENKLLTDGGILLSFYLSNGLPEFSHKYRVFNSMVLKNGIVLDNLHYFRNYHYDFGGGQYFTVSITRFEGNLDTEFMWYSEKS